MGVKRPDLWLEALLWLGWFCYEEILNSCKVNCLVFLHFISLLMCITTYKGHINFTAEMKQVESVTYDWNL